MTETLTIFIVGGYGTFGGRIVSLLEQEARLTLVIAGRSLDRARAFRDARGTTAARLVAAAFDRDGPIDAPLRQARPDILVDASGPFQSYGARPWRLVEACVAHGIHYLDLADGSDFVADIGQFDEAARARGVFALSGASTFPVLSAAVVLHLARDMVRVTAIRGGIAPSPFAEVGGNVIRAIAGYAGQPVRVRRDGTDSFGFPFAEQMRVTVAPPGVVPLRSRLFSLVDVPDLRLFAELWPDVETVWMGAAPVPELPHRVLIALAWLVRLRLAPSLAPLAPLMLFVSNHVRWGEHRGGMFVSVDGVDTSGAARRRSWHMVAERDDGPLIPSMAVAAVVRRVLAGREPPPGARAAAGDVELEDYAPLFAQRNIVAGTRDDAADVAVPLYAGILGSAFDRLPAEIRAMHQTERAEGRATVTRGDGVLARLIATVFGFPAAAEDVPVRVDFQHRHGGEIWTRVFGERSLRSRQFAGAGRWEHLLRERFGAVTFAIALVVEAGRLSLVFRGWSMFGLPLPPWLGPRVTAFETADAGLFHFHVDIGHRLTGRIVHYRGWLAPSAAENELW